MNTKDVSYLGEIWKDIIEEGFEGIYEGNEFGEIRNKETKKILKPSLNKGGYPLVVLCNNSKRKTRRVHRLIYEAFNGKIPKGFEVNHINEIKTDSRLCNLNLLSHKANVNWGTGIERRAKARRNDKKISKPVIQKTLQGEVVKIWPSTIEIQRELGYSQGNICKCCNGKYKQMYDYKWEYKI